MMDGDFTIRISILENGFTVEVPDYEMIEKLEAEQKKSKSKSEYPQSMHIGGCSEKLVAKSAKEVVDIVNNALAKLPQDVYAEAFEEATKMNRSGEPGGKK